MATNHTLKKAQELVQQNRHDEARICLLELLQNEPDNQAALLMLGGAYYCSGKYAEAEMVFERLIIQFPGNGKFSIGLFNTLWKMDRHEEALEEIRRFFSQANHQEEKETIEQYMAITRNMSKE